MHESDETEGRARLEKNKEKFKRLREEFDQAAKDAKEPNDGPTILGPKDELSYRRMKRELDEQAGDDE